MPSSKEIRETIIQMLGQKCNDCGRELPMRAQSLVDLLRDEKESIVGYALEVTLYPTEVENFQEE
jgi:hypothetical protein